MLIIANNVIDLIHQRKVERTRIESVDLHGRGYSRIGVDLDFRFWLGICCYRKTNPGMIPMTKIQHRLNGNFELLIPG